jgi:hypothetical protein
MKIKDLPQPYKEMALIEQEEQGNKRNKKLRLTNFKNQDNFDWMHSICGDNFWVDVDRYNYPEITPEIKAKFPSVFKDELIEKWEHEAKTLELYAENHADETDFIAYKNRAEQLRLCIKDYEKFINLKK